MPNCHLQYVYFDFTVYTFSSFKIINVMSTVCCFVWERSYRFYDKILFCLCFFFFFTCFMSWHMSSKPYNFRQSTKHSVSIVENRLTKKPKPRHDFAQMFPVFKPNFTQNELNQYKSLKNKGKYLFTNITLPYSMTYINLNRTEICVSAISYPETKQKCILAHDLLLNVPGYSSFVQKFFNIINRINLNFLFCFNYN